LIVALDDLAASQINATDRMELRRSYERDLKKTAPLQSPIVLPTYHHVLLANHVFRPLHSHLDHPSSG
jgi:hypothetical protein